MLYLPACNGFDPLRGWRTHTSRSKDRGKLAIRHGLIKKKNPPKQLGSLLITNPLCSLWEYNLHKLGAMAAYWSDSLSSSQRTAWDAVAPSGYTGFEYFMDLNLTGYALYASTFPSKGQNFGDAQSCGDWDFTPPFPVPVAGWFSPTKTSLVLTFTGADRFHFATITGAASVTARAEFITAYSTRPYASYWNPSTNPLLRLGALNASASGVVKFEQLPNPVIDEDISVLWNRVIGGATAGQHIRYGYRFGSKRSPVGIPGPLHQATATVI